MAKQTEKADTSVSNEQPAPSLSQVAAFCKRLNLTAEQVGGWIWVSFAEKPDEAIRQALRDFGFRWSYRRKKWAHNCGVPSRSAAKSDPWQKYEHKFVSKAGGAA